MRLTLGTRLGPYEITGTLGEGGMGVVYAAVDTRLGRRVAIKVLPAEFVADPERRRRFMQEARAASALSHPHIAHVYDIVDEGQRHGIVMELVEGTRLDTAIAAGPLPLRTALDYATQIADALHAAHGAGIVHRDIKPANIMIGRDGRVKVLDFGLAKLAVPSAGSDSTMTAVGTRIGTIMGSAAYMSPEQAQGRPVDARSDLFSFGAVLYEMLAGRRPFTGDTELGVISSILQATPEPLRGVPRDIEAIVQRALQKTPDARYPNAAGMRGDLSAALARLTARREAVWKRPSVLVPAGLALAAVIAIGTWQTVQARGVRWARETALPEIERVQGTNRALQAVLLARAAEKYVPGEIARLRQGWWSPRIATQPAGATIEIRNYMDVNGGWEPFGAAPAQLALPIAFYRMRLTSAGHVPLEVAGDLGREFRLAREGTDPAGMVHVPAGEFAYGALPRARIPSFWIDRLEVTNRDYKAFVDAGGYKDAQYWREPFEDAGRTLTFADAIARFRDATGRPGPASWDMGTYPDGQADFPVGGISWFEAAAYARFAGKQLPTVHQWFYASGVDEPFSDILLLSNYDGKGPARAGARGGLGPWGTLDMAGNVKEWCANLAAGTTQRHTLGGSWNEPSYRFNDTEAREPWDRSVTIGVRLVKNEGTPEGIDGPVGILRPDPKTIVPVGDAEYELFKRFYAYDRTPLDVRTIGVDEGTAVWKKETVSFLAAYGGERITAYFFTPKNATPPYQTLLLFPTSYARAAASSAHLDMPMFEFLMKSGRAVLYPVYQGTYERRAGVTAGQRGIRDMNVAIRDMNVQWAKDVFRAVDYLETRRDVDMTRLGYFSVSMGAFFGPIPVALEPRLKVAVFAAGGLRYRTAPETQPVNFMPHVTVPVLLVNGRDDFSATPDAQRRFIELIGTPADKKRHAMLDGGHVPSDWRQVIRETLDWYDKYLGPVK